MRHGRPIPPAAPATLLLLLGVVLEVVLAVALAVALAMLLAVVLESGEAQLTWADARPRPSQLPFPVQ